MSILKKLAGQTAVYGLSSIVGRFLNYLLVPLYTGVLAPSAFGMQSWFYAFASFGAVIFTYGMETAFFNFSRQRPDKERVFSTILISILISSAVLALILFGLAKPITQSSWAKQSGNETYFYYIIIILAADAITTIPFAWLRQQNEAMRFAMLRLLSIGVNIVLNLLFYLVFPYLVSKGLFAPLSTDGLVSIKWIFFANVASSLVVLPFFFKEFKMIKYGFDAGLWKEMFIYSYPLIFMGFAGMINETMDRMLLNAYITDPSVANHETGIYAANYKLSILITLFIQAFRFAAEPFFFSRAKDGDAPKTYAQVMHYFVIVCATIFLVVVLYLDIFKHFIRRESYWEGLKVVPILLLANIFLGIYYNLSIWYKLTNKTRLGAIVSIAGACITLILNILWIPLYSYMGSAWATLICYGSMAFMSYALGQKYYPVPYPLKRIGAHLALSLTIYLMSEMLKETFNFTSSVSLLVNSFLMGVYLFIVYKMEEQAIQGFLGKNKVLQPVDIVKNNENDINVTPQ
jgi:O-antigen/teichoic acid export membrane protein